MSQKMLQGGLSQAFVSLGTLRGMSEVARRMAVIGRTVKGIRDVEDRLQRTVDDKSLKQAMIEIAAYSKFAGRNASEAADILKQMVPGIESYLMEVERNAVD